jgi:hypothetical protein
VCLSADLKDLSKPVRILGEDLIASVTVKVDPVYYFSAVAIAERHWNTDEWKREAFDAAIMGGFTT